jgi:hypothetical protein
MPFSPLSPAVRNHRNAVRLASESCPQCLGFRTLAEAGDGVAVIQTAVPVSRYKLRIVRLTYRHKPIRLPMAAIWDKRRTLPKYARAYFELTGDHIGIVFPVTKPRN